MFHKSLFLTENALLKKQKKNKMFINYANKTKYMKMQILDLRVLRRTLFTQKQQKERLLQ